MPLCDEHRVTIRLPLEKVSGFASLLQHGILYAIDRPVDIRAFLLALPGFSAEYIEKNVQTIFINGVAADNLDHPLGAGGTLALSAAMPGLAGAIFRRQGPHGSLRSQSGAKKDPLAGESGYLTLKLFNRVAADRVYDLTSQGILIENKAFRNFAMQREHLFQAPVKLFFAGQLLQYSEMLQLAGRYPLVAIQLQTFE